MGSGIKKMKKNILEDRKKMLIKKAIEYIEEARGYDLCIDIKGYDGCDFDAGTLADDLRIEFDLED